MVGNGKASSSNTTAVVLCGLAFLVSIAWLASRHQAATAPAAPPQREPTSDGPTPPATAHTAETIAPDFTGLPPSQRVARVFNLLNSRADRASAYAEAEALLADFPRASPQFVEARALLREISAQKANLQRRAAAREIAPGPAYPPAGADSQTRSTHDTRRVDAPRAFVATPSDLGSYSGYPCAENGSCYGDVSAVTGRAKTQHVSGYYRSDGTHVRGYYRSPGRRR